LKGHFDNGVSYAFDVFDVNWKDPQVAGATPATGNFAVWNAKRAKSTGVEFDLSSPLFLSGLSIAASGAYANARFTENYSIAAANFAGVLTPGLIHGYAGQQLPGSPKTSAAATISYDRIVAPGYELLLALNDTYRSAMPLRNFAAIFGGVPQPPPAIPPMNIANASAAVRHNAWGLGVYVKNLADKRVALTSGYGFKTLGGLADDYLINRPREIQVRLTYSY
jgi:hypothetical protein